jgi:catechol 2,3-dioxygenase-like lactoylglutathione lyase family enzyme
MAYIVRAMKFIRALVAKSLLLLCVVTLHAQPKRPAITGVAFGRFYSADAAASQHFYGDTLGLQKIAVGTKAIYPINSLQWIETVPLPDPALKSRQEAIGFTTRDAAALVQYLKAKGVAIEHPLHEGMFSVRDPEGNQVWFVQTGANKLVANSKPSPRASSQRLIHVGFVVKDEPTESAFYQGILGFHLYWKGGGKDDRIDWQSMQVPDGTDWLEYMLHVAPDASLKTIGVLDHASLGTEDMAKAVTILKANGCTDGSCDKSRTGRDGKVQLNLYDPDLTRIEMMEFTPREAPCCSPILGKNPSAVESR